MQLSHLYLPCFYSFLAHGWRWKTVPCQMDPLKVVHMLPVIWESLGLLSQWLFIHRRSKKSCCVAVLKNAKRSKGERTCTLFIQTQCWSRFDPTLGALLRLRLSQIPVQKTCEPWHTGAKRLALNKHSTAGSGERLRRTAARRAGKGDTEKAPPEAPASASAFWIQRHEAAFSPIYVPRKAHRAHVKSLRPLSTQPARLGPVPSAAHPLTWCRRVGGRVLSPQAGPAKTGDARAATRRPLPPRAQRPASTCSSSTYAGAVASPTPLPSSSGPHWPQRATLLPPAAHRLAQAPADQRDNPTPGAIRLTWPSHLGGQEAANEPK